MKVRDGYISVAWKIDKPEDITVKKVEYSLDQGKWITADQSPMEFTINNLQAGREYFVSLKVELSNGEFRTLAPKSFKAKEAIPPGPPRNLTITDLGDGTVRLNWDPPISD